MRHTPYGYDIINGKPVVNEEEATIIRKICEYYLSGMSFENAAANAGLIKSHCSVKRILQKKQLLGDDLYPSIITEETAKQIEEERIRRAKARGLDHKAHKQVDMGKVQTKFLVLRIHEKYKDPIRQAEWAYSQIREEVGK